MVWIILERKMSHEANGCDHKEARQILADGLEISDSLGVRTLRKMITDRMEDLNRLSQEA